MKPTPIVLDCDPGHDDALAMILAAHNPVINLLAITTVSGNGIIAKVTQNALSICALAKINVPVAEGAGNAILGYIEAATDIHGETALDGAPLPTPAFELEKISGVDLIAKVVREHPEKVTLVATGPLTNIALSFLSSTQNFVATLQRSYLWVAAPHAVTAHHMPNSIFGWILRRPMLS